MNSQAVWGKLSRAVYLPEFTLTYFSARSNFATQAFIKKNVTVMVSLEIIAAFDMEIG